MEPPWEEVGLEETGRWNPMCSSPTIVRSLPQLLGLDMERHSVGEGDCPLWRTNLPGDELKGSISNRRRQDPRTTLLKSVLAWSLDLPERSTTRSGAWERGKYYADGKVPEVKKKGT